MSIRADDIILLESERMADTADGGGQCTSRVIPDGVAGSIFPKVSRMDAVYGRGNLRKVFGKVNAPNLEMYAGAHFIVSAPPQNERIHICAFTTGSAFDTRAEARDFVERYVIAGPESRMTLYGRQLKNAKALLLYQRVEEPLPEVGDVYAASMEPGGITTVQQFVRVQDVSHEVRTFTDTSGDFQRRVITLILDTSLRYEFVGVDTPSRTNSGGAAAIGKMRLTTVADAARYYSIQPTTAIAAQNALTLQLSSIFTHIVPTTQREAAVNLATVSGAIFARNAATAPISEYLGTYNYTQIRRTFVLQRTPAVGSVVLRYLRTDYPVTWTDNGAGILVSSNPNFYPDCTIDYELHSITVSEPQYGLGISKPLYCDYLPIASVSTPSHMVRIPITLANRGTVFSVPLDPPPAPGTLIVDFHAQGRWYRLRDNGNGELVGADESHGTGTVDYIGSGSVVTLGAQPDVGSSLIYSWGSPVHFSARIGDAGATVKLEAQLEHLPVRRGSLTITYTSSGVDYTATVTFGGIVSGGGVAGTLRHSTGKLAIELTDRLPDMASIVRLNYEQDTSNGEPAFTPTGEFPVFAPHTLAEAPFVVGSMNLTVVLSTDVEVPALTRDNGEIYIEQGVPVTNSWYSNTSRPVTKQATTIGGLNWETGAIVIHDVQIPYEEWVYLNDSTEITHTGWVLRTVQANIQSGSLARWTATVVDAAAMAVPHLHEIAMVDNPIIVDLTRTSTSTVVPESVMFSVTGKTYVDRNGTLYADVEPNGSGMAAGAFDYTSGQARLTYWGNGQPLNLSVQSCLVKFGDWPATEAFFRTAGSPLRPASTYVRVTSTDGELLTGVSDASGNISGIWMSGTVEQSMGVVAVQFGRMLDGVWQPRQVLIETLRYSTVVLSHLPLNADLLGLDPVRLPSDGKVPCFRQGDLAVLHHTENLLISSPAAGATISVGRDKLAALWLEDTARQKLPETLYAVNLEAGSLTFAADLDLSGNPLSIVAKHRIEEMVLLSDVQISGQVSLTAPLSREFPVGSYLSSALPFGDLQARVENVFEQHTWLDVWQATLMGDRPAAQYDTINFPIEVLNNGAVTERWRLNFTSNTAYQVVGENLGVVATGTVAADLTVLNPLTGLPYFVLRWRGFSGGWAPGYQLRFDTVGATPPIWLLRAVLAGASLSGDSFDAQLRGDVD